MTDDSIYPSNNQGPYFEGRVESSDFAHTFLPQDEDPNKQAYFEYEDVLDTANFVNTAQDTLPTVQISEETELYSQTEEPISRWQRVKEWSHKNRAKISIGILATSLSVTLLSNPFNEIKDKVIEAAPWVGMGVFGSEIAFTAGGAMMVSAIGSKIGNPLKIKSRIPEISAKANDSRLFKTGFVINALGAVGDFLFISAGVIKEMPVSSYPLLSLTLLDLAGTIAVRKAILGGIRDNKDQGIELSYVPRQNLEESE